MIEINTGIEKTKETIRNFENTKYYGYLFYVKYDGKKFDSFDENPNEKSVKSEFRKILEKNKINFYKGIQQAGRTDKNVSANNNILYVNSKDNIYINKIKNDKIKELKILKIEKTLPFLEIPNLIERRYYIYEYPKELIKNNDKEILIKSSELSGIKNFKKFTNKKGEKLKKHIREILISYENDKLYFDGDSFLPQQVRIMSAFILNNTMKPLDGKYLTLDKVKLKEDLENLIFKEIDKNIILNIENIDFEIKKTLKNKIEKIEKNNIFYIFYVKKENKSELIGKKGKNIKKIKKILGDIVIKEIN